MIKDHGEFLWKNENLGNNYVEYCGSRQFRLRQESCVNGGISIQEGKYHSKTEKFETPLLEKYGHEYNAFLKS